MSKPFVFSSPQILLTLLLLGAFPAAGAEIDCDRGDSLPNAIAAAPAGATLYVSGTCTGAITITRDLTIAGDFETFLDATGAETDGIRIEGARVRLEKLTVIGGINSINAISGSFLTLEDVVVRNAAEDGIRIEQGDGLLIRTISRDHGVAGMIFLSGSVILHDSRSNSNGNVGIRVGNTASARFFGLTALNGNGSHGISFEMGGSVLGADAGPGAKILANENGGHGFFFSSSSGFIFLFSVEANRNGGDGIHLNRSSSLLLGAGPIPGSLNTTNNGGSGVRVTGGSSVTISSGMQHKSRRNGAAGILVDLGGSATLTGITAQQNQTGLAVDDGSVVVNSSVLTNNETLDADLTFGARATFADNRLGDLECGDGVLVRGDQSCP